MATTLKYSNKLDISFQQGNPFIVGLIVLEILSFLLLTFLIKDSSGLTSVLILTLLPIFYWIVTVPIVANRIWNLQNTDNKILNTLGGVILYSFALFFLSFIATAFITSVVTGLLATLTNSK